MLFFETAADADGRSERVTGAMTLLFGFTAPEPVQMVQSGVIAALGLHRACVAQSARLEFSTSSSFGAFGFAGEEELRLPGAHGQVSPVDARAEL